MSEVTEADREAAAELYRRIFPMDDLRHLNISLGNIDDGVAVQAFARHREATEEAAYQRGLIEGARLGLEAAAEWFAERFSEAVQTDTENGVKCLNERAAAAYLKDAPDTLAAICEGDAAIRALDIPSILKDEA